MDGSEKPGAMGEVIQIDESRIRADLGEMVRMFGREIKPGHYRWLGMDTGPNAPKQKRSSRHSGGGSSGGW